MQIIIHFLNTLDLFWKGAITITPKIPLIIGAPPTTATAVELVPNQGSKKKAKVMESALKIPKYNPNAMNKNMKFFYLTKDLIAYIK
jgi:hypothetical protein